MKRLSFLLSFLAGLAAANPYVVTYISEFSTDTTGGQWLELHRLPGSGSRDMNRWQIVTTTSVCTLHCGLSGYLVIDSANLAQRTYGSGKFRLNPDHDSIVLLDTNGWTVQRVSYPHDPTGESWSAAPPQGGSASFWNVDFAWAQAFNWYIDSTPTPGEENNSYGTIMGTVLLDSMLNYEDVYVYPYGRYAGECLSYGWVNPGYCIQGLGMGWYRVEAYVWTSHGALRGFFPDSLYVGQGETLAGIDIDLRGQGVAEQPELPAVVAPTLHAAGMQLVVFCPMPIDARLAVHDLTGACRAVLYEGLLEPGVHRFDLTSRVGAGVYFARLASEDRTAVVKVIVPR